MSENKINSPLRIVCVGTGRDGTTSLAQLIQYIFDHEGRGEKVMHEWGSVDLYNYYCDYVETKDESNLEKIRQLLKSCPADCIVGNGYASILPIFREVFGQNLVIVHLKRRDKDAFVASMSKNAEMFPTNHHYYADPAHSVNKRMAAFHYDECSYEEWCQWSVQNKFAWYYDKTHQLVEKYANLFDRVYNVYTESLESVEMRQLLSEAASSQFVPPPVHLNKHFDIESVPLAEKMWVQRFLGKLDIPRLAYDSTYGISHSLNELVEMMSCKLNNTNRNDAKAMACINNDLNNAKSLLRDYLNRLQRLEEENNRSGLYWRAYRYCYRKLSGIKRRIKNAVC